MGEIKQHNFRIDSEKADAFRTFCEENGMNQAQGFDHMMQVLELDLAKNQVPERMVEIEDFELHVKSIMNAFLKSLELAKNTEARVLEQFQSRMESKDKMIETLQKQIEAKDSLMAASQTACFDAENERNRAEKSEKEALDKLKEAKETIKDKENINSMLTLKLAEAESKIAAIPETTEKIAVLEKRVSEMEIEKERAVRNTEDRIRSEKEKENLQLQIEIAKAQGSAEERIREIEKLEKQIEKLQEENSFLRVELAELRAKQDK